MRTIFHLLCFAGLCAFGLTPHAKAQEGDIRAEPNPCRIEGGRKDCTTHLIWHTRGVERAKVFVVGEGRHPAAEKEFSATRACEGHNCRAPWIEPETRYTFTLVDFTHGDRGKVLGSVVVTAER